MKDYLDLLASSRLFENVPRELIRDEILPRGRVTAYPKGSAVILPGDRVTDVRILLSGKIRPVYYAENGDEDRKFPIFPPKAVGIDLICTRTKLSPYLAGAAEPSEIFSFPSELLLEPGQLPEEMRQTCIRNLLLILSHVNMQNEYRLAILTQNGLRDRILVYLRMQANKAGSRTFSIPFSREEMASFLRVNRSALSHELSLMRADGILDFRKNEFTLKE